MKETETKQEKPLKLGVFIPSFVITGGAAILGLVGNEWLTSATYTVFGWSLRNFAWLYQIVAMFTLIMTAIMTFSRTGRIQFGGPKAKAKYSFASWFAMILTVGIATDLIAYGANEPLIYFGNIYGRLTASDITPGTPEAVFFATGRVFYNWSFIPYVMYALSGVIIGYLYYNHGQELSVSGSLTPLFGPKVTQGPPRDVIDTLSVLAIVLGLASSLDAGLALVGSGLQSAYGIAQGPVLWFALTVLIIATFTVSSVQGIDKEIKWLADLASKIFYALVAALILIGPTLYVLSMTNVGMGCWLDHFWSWGLDLYVMGGEAPVTWWTMYDWAIWIAYAPLMGIFFAMISYSRMIRQFLVANWIAPVVFSIVWFSIWGATALDWQTSGVADMASIIQQDGAVAGIWEFLRHVPLSAVSIPTVIITLIAEYANTANGMATVISSICTKGSCHGEEPATWLKILWGVTIDLISAVMVAFGGGGQGADGAKYLVACGGFAVLFMFVLQVASTFKVFSPDKGTKKDIVDSEDLIEGIEETEQEVGKEKARAEALS